MSEQIASSACGLFAKVIQADGQHAHDTEVALSNRIRGHRFDLR